MKQIVLDMFSKTGRLRTRLEEIVAQVEKQSLPRMEGGDLIGRQVVATLTSATTRDAEDSRLLFQAQQYRAQMYHESSGATALEAAEALVDARAALRDYASTAAELGGLAPVAWGVLQDLVRIGSRRNAWSVFNVLFDAVEGAPCPSDMRPKVVDLFSKMMKSILEQKNGPEVLDTLTRMTDWTQRNVPERLNEVVAHFAPAIAGATDQCDADRVLAAFLQARHLCVAFQGRDLRRIVRKLADAGRKTAEVRAIYQDFLSGQPKMRARVELTFARLADVDPDPTLGPDEDLEALADMLEQHYGEAVWVWRNRALLFRRRRDSVGAVACLARAMNISGQPPEIMAVLAPTVLALGFFESARVFASFVSDEVRERFGLSLLDELAETPGADDDKRKLLSRLEAAAKSPGTPLEFRRPLMRRAAEVLFALDQYQMAAEKFDSLYHDDPTDELALVALAECCHRLGNDGRAHALLECSLTARAHPLAEHLRSRLAEKEGRHAAALEHTDTALASISDAHAAGRDLKQKSLVALATRIVRMFGKEHANSALLSILESEVFGTRHFDIDLLGPILERRAVELALRSGDVNRARLTVRDITARHPADTEIFVHGVRASLRSGHVDDAREFLQRATDSGHGASAEVLLLRGLLACRSEEFAEARTSFEAAQATVPTAESRLALAAMALRDGNEADAFKLVSASSDDEGGVPEVRRRIHDLRGRLLERQGRRTEALSAYFDAVACDSSWNDSRRRAGLLAVESGLAADGTISNDMLLRRGMLLLEGFNDGDSVTHHALASAAVAGGDAAIDLLSTTLCRVSGGNWTAIMLAKTRLLLAAGRFEDAKAAIEATLAEAGLPEDAESELRRRRADILRREAFAAMTGLESLDAAGLAGPRAVLEEAAHSAPDPQFDSVIAWLDRMTAAGGADTVPLPDAPLAKSVADAFVVASALVRSGQPSTVSHDRLNRIAARADRNPTTLAARLLVALSAGTESPQDVRRAVEELSAAGKPLPFALRDVWHACAVKALRIGDTATIDGLLAGKAEGLLDIRCFSQLEAISRAENADAAHVLGILLELDRVTDGHGLGDVELDRKLDAMRRRVTDMREQPSPAWASSRLRTAGKRTRLTSPEIIDFWIGRGATGDAAARHPIALMRLAAAHEQEVTAGHCDEAWRVAHAAWHALMNDDAFWRDLTARLEAIAPTDAPAAVAAIRQDVPRWLLQAHLAYAKSRLFSGDLARAIAHGRLVAQSPLLELTDSRLRDEVYTSLTGNLERHLAHRRFEDALACIDHVIVADPTNPIALREMARVAATALQQNLAMIDVLVRTPDAQTIAEVSTIMGRILAVAARPVTEFSRAGVTEPQTAKAVATCLRAKAWVAFYRDQAVAEAGEALDLAIFALKSTGQDFSALAKFRSEIGLRVVADTMRRAPGTATHRIGEGDPIEQAMAEIDRLLALDSENVKVITQKVRLLFAANRDSEAETLARDLFRRAQQRAEPGCVRAAVELLHLVQVGREKLRFDGKINLIDELTSQRNWRDAHALLKDATAGRENDPEILRRSVEIFLGLHKLEPIEALIDQLLAVGAKKDECVVWRARLACLRHMCLIGGDLLAAFELHERGGHEKAREIAEDLLRGTPVHPAARYVAAVAAAGAKLPEIAQRHAQSACAEAGAADFAWISVLLASVLTGGKT